MRTLIVASLAAFLLMAGTPNANAADGLIVKPSKFGVAKTLDRLAAILKKMGITIFARVNHTAGAKRVGKKLRPTQLLIFGNPKMGTPLMQSRRSMGIDLPMKVLAWKDTNGKIWIAYNSPKYLAKRHRIKNRGKLFKKMAVVLRKLTDKAAGQ